MAYKLLYVEDLDPQSIVSDLRNNGFEIEHFDPNTFENLLTEVEEKGYNAILLDFRLTQGKGNARFDAPTIAQTQRTKSSTTHNHYPIFLISTEANISAFYEDFTSNDLFDLSIAKEAFQKNLPKFCNRITDFIESYRAIVERKCDLSAILNISKESLNLLDHRFIEKFNDPKHKNNTFKISRLVYNTFIRTIGELIGEDVLSARLGVDIKSPGWDSLRDEFAKVKYKGIYSNSHNRWWANEVLIVCKEKFAINNLRRLNASERTDRFIQAGIKDLKPIEKLQFADSTNFWTICADLKCPIDPIDGLELISKEIIPWQDTEYISLLAAMKSSPLNEKLKVSEKERFLEFVKEQKK